MPDRDETIGVDQVTREERMTLGGSPMTDRYHFQPTVGRNTRLLWLSVQEHLADIDRRLTVLEQAQQNLGRRGPKETGDA